ncbi:hypothetical protein PVPAM_050043000 [Plasmodium vivax]|nr:hypothetical protein PVPAM_050043000 [Plasmodium vivax]
MSLPCPELKKGKDIKNEFEPRCATRLFKTIHTSWDNINGQYLKHINEINDPVLRYISIYFVQYYIDGYDYYKNSINHHRGSACTYLNLWLQEKKDLFTFGEKCSTNLGLWKDNIEKLLGMLENVYTITDNNGERPWCKINELSGLTKFTNDVTLPSSCRENISQESSSTCPPPLPEKTHCDCSQNEVSLIPSEPVQAPEADRTKNLAVTSGFTAAGTLGTLFFLYRFTPMASWFRRPGMNNVGTDLYMDAGAPDGFLSMQNGNGGNNLFYQP